MCRDFPLAKLYDWINKMKPKRYIEFKIEIAENLNANKIIILTNPEHEELLMGLLYKLQKELEKFGED